MGTQLVTNMLILFTIYPTLECEWLYKPIQDIVIWKNKEIIFFEVGLDKRQQRELELRVISVFRRVDSEICSSKQCILHRLISTMICKALGFLLKAFYEIDIHHNNQRCVCTFWTHTLALDRDLKFSSS